MNSDLSQGISWGSSKVKASGLCLTNHCDGTVGHSTSDSFFFLHSNWNKICNFPPSSMDHSLPRRDCNTDLQSISVQFTTENKMVPLVSSWRNTNWDNRKHLWGPWIWRVQVPGPGLTLKWSCGLDLFCRWERNERKKKFRNDKVTQNPAAFTNSKAIELEFIYFTSCSGKRKFEKQFIWMVSESMVSLRLIKFIWNTNLCEDLLIFYR